jgi:hypothetical protein
MEKIDSARVRLNASFHPEFANLEEFLGKASQLKINGFSTSVSFVAYPPHLENLREIATKCKDRDTTLIIQLFRGSYRNKNYPADYTASEAELIELFGGSVSVNRTQLLSNLYQNTGIKRICSSGSLKIGNLLDDANFRLFKEPEPCGIEDCVCWKRMLLGEEDKWMAHWF